MKKLNLLFLAIAFHCASAQNVNIPDAKFKAALVGNSSINTNGDTEIQVSEAMSYTGESLLAYDSAFSISDLTGEVIVPAKYHVA